MNKWIKRIFNVLIILGILGLSGCFTKPLAADITALEGTTGYIGKEDIRWGTGQATDTFTVTTYDGGSATLTKVPDPDAADESVIKGVWYVAAMAGDHGNAALTGSLAWVIAVIDGDPAVVELPGNQTYQVSTNLAVPSTIYLKIDKGGILTPDAAKTVDLNGPVGAGAYQIIDETAGGTVNLNFNQLEHDKWRDGTGDAILPSVTNTIDLGSITQKFKDGHFAGDATVDGGITVAGQTTTARISGHSFPGFVVRATFTYKDADEIYIDAGVYYHNGTSEQLLYWDSQITYQFTSLAVSDWSYLYLDDSAIVTAATNLISASELTDSLTEPGVWSNTKHGRYNGEDLCFFAVRTDGSGNINEFWHDGGALIYNGDEIGIISTNTIIPTTWTDIGTAFVMPSFARKGRIRFDYVYEDLASIWCYWRPKGSSVTTGQYLSYMASTSGHNVHHLDVITDSDHLIQWKQSSSTNKATIFQLGWWLPNGM